MKPMYLVLTLAADAEPEVDGYKEVAVASTHAEAVRIARRLRKKDSWSATVYVAVLEKCDGKARL